MSALPAMSAPLTMPLPLSDALAARALELWPLPKGARARLVNLSENATFIVEADGWKSVLRLHRPGYHTARAIESELVWSQALRRDGVLRTPACIPGRNGRELQALPGSDGAPRYLVMFEYVEGAPPEAERSDLRALFETLGRMAANLHRHTLDWTPPPGFERPHWDVDAVFGPSPAWGNWRAAPGLTPEIAACLEVVEVELRRRLREFGTAPERYGLIHADMRLANLLVHDETLAARREPSLIDFDDCGYGWHLYDFAASVSFHEDDPRLPKWKAAWLRGYRAVRPLSETEEDELDTFIMLRRMALLAWIGSHYEAPEAQALAPDFARVTARLGHEWLRRAAPVLIVSAGLSPPS